MNAEQLIQSLQDPAALSSITAEELNELVTAYPWFGTAQVLSAIKQKQLNSAEASMQLQKALLYSQHPLWLQYQLNRYTEPQEEVIEAPFVQEVTLQEESVRIQMESTIQDEADAVMDAQVLVEAVNEQEAQTMIDETEAAVDAEVIIEAVDEQEINTMLSEAETISNAEVMIHATDEQDVQAVLNAAEVTANAEVMIDAADAQEPPADFKPLSDLLKQPVPENATLSFEPLHTVDYFASQGIKLREEKLGNDKLGQQLKTFTQWLKTLKKADPAHEMPLDETAEKQLVQMAGGSNRGEEIITEAMALVLEQQGKAQKAAELYHKLSLLHPEKSAYFASQIQRLNQ